jgi:transcriptional antiterminator NusG
MTKGLEEQVEKKEPKWYAVHTYSGYEDAVERYLKQRIESHMMADKIIAVIVPKETKIRVKNGKRHVTHEKIYPGYVLVNMVMDHDSWAVVRNTPRVTGFVGADSTTPAPLSDAEIQDLMNRMGPKDPKFNVDLKKGDLVRIADGPFRDHEGKIAEVDEERGKVKVYVSVFNRDTLVEIDSLQVKKV